MALSFTEVEAEPGYYVTASDSSREHIWLHYRLGELIALALASQSASLRQPERYHPRQGQERPPQRSDEAHRHHQVVERGFLELTYCPTNEMAVDLLTGPLVGVNVEHLSPLLGLRPTS